MNKFITSALFSALAFQAVADTTDHKWITIIELEKQGEHCADDPNCFNRYHPEVSEKATANIGDIMVYHTRDALDTKFTLDSTPADLATVDLGLVHPMTGPVRINGAQRGDAILEQLGSLPNASSPKAMLQVRNVHVDSLTAITTFLASS